VSSIKSATSSCPTVKDGIAFKDRYLYFIVAGEQQGLPFFFSAIFKSELVVRMIGTDKLSEFIEGRELLVF
jgi:hypothetical protein